MVFKENMIKPLIMDNNFFFFSLVYIGIFLILISVFLVGAFAFIFLSGAFLVYRVYLYEKQNNKHE